MTSIPANLSHRHTDHATGHILYIDPVTGEVISQKPMVRRKDPEAAYQAWASKRRAEDLSTDYATAQAGIEKTTTATTPAVSSEPVKRGRPQTRAHNPAAIYMPFIAVPHLLAWADDIIHGSIITSSGVSNGKINVKARAVVAALFLSEISAEACKTSEHTLRTAQRIAKAARHAGHGLVSYIERHPKLKAEIEDEMAAEALFRASPA
jgi:hypothetical protein